MTSLPPNVESLSQRWEVIEKPCTAPTWDFMWNGLGEESREKQFVQQSFLAGGNEIPTTRRYDSEQVYVADSALKVN